MLYVYQIYLSSQLKKPLKPCFFCFFRCFPIILSEKNIQNSGYADAIGCSLFDYQEFSDVINEKQGKKQKKHGFKGFFSWLDQYI